MTFQEAQARFSSIVGSITMNMTSGELAAKQVELQALQNSLPLTHEFDPISDAIAEYSPKLVGIITRAVLTSLQSRAAALEGASTLLDRVSSEAEADARTLTFEKPRLVLAALTESVNALKDVRAAAEARDFESAASKVDAVVMLIEQVRTSIKAT